VTTAVYPTEMMLDPIAKSQFDCVDRNGNEFVATVAIGEPSSRDVAHGRTERLFAVSFDPFFAKRQQGGLDSLTALCFAIELVRKALRVFVAHGGSVYMHGTRSPIDIDDPYFTPIGGIIDRKFIDGDPAPGSPWLQDGG
jgi:hypothetical protein